MDRLVQVPNDVSSSINPLLDNFHADISETLRRPLSDIALILSRTQISEDDRQNLLHLLDLLSSSPLGPAVANELRHELGIQDTAVTGSPSPTGAGDVQSHLQSLGERLSRLENSQDPAVSIQNYLDSLGLNVDALRRLANSSRAPAAQFAFLGWEWGRGRQE